jgi:hypothetical protein
MSKYPYTALLCFVRSDIVESNLLLSQPSTSKQKPELNQSYSSISQSSATDTSIATVQETSSSITRQMKMTQFILNKISKIKIDNALAYFIATNMMPYSLVKKRDLNYL